MTDHSNESISGNVIMGSLPFFAPLSMVAVDDVMPMIGDQQEGGAEDDETLTDFTCMTGEDTFFGY
jgi:hypothetical protein